MAFQAANKKTKQYTDNFSLEALLIKNEEYKNKFQNNLLFRLMRSGQFSSSEKKEKLLGYLHTWSGYFQKMMFLKTALCEDPAFAPLFSQHLEEEYGHDKILFQERKTKTTKADAILEAICNWFPAKILSFTPHEQLVLVNLCLEAASTIFHEYAVPAIDPNRQLKYLQLHEELDVDHEKMGISLLENLSKNHYSRLFNIQELSWNMFEALMTRIAELCTEK
jgi:hypothetical protein